MLDIVEIVDGKDLGLADTVVTKAGNVISTQIGTLDYAPDFGVDLKFFLFSELNIQRESFKAHLVEKLSFNQINVNSIIEQFQSLYMKLIWDVSGAVAGDVGEQTVTEFGNVLITDGGDTIVTNQDIPIGV